MNNSSTTESSKPIHGRSRGKKWVIGLVVMASLMALFYAEENFRHLGAWRKYKQELIASGAQLDWKSYLPKRVPDDKNFVKTPLLEAIGYGSNTNAGAFDGLPFGQRLGVTTYNQLAAWNVLAKLHNIPAGSFVADF